MYVLLLWKAYYIAYVFHSYVNHHQNYFSLTKAVVALGAQPPRPLYRWKAVTLSFLYVQLVFWGRTD
jgi:hypothetical protein